MQDIVDLVNNVGFPIVCCVFMFKQNSKLTDTINDLKNTLSNIDKKIDILEREVRMNEQKNK